MRMLGKPERFLGNQPNVIGKNSATLRPRPNLVDYAAECARFDWSKAWKLLDGLPGRRGYNIAYEAVDRHALGARTDRVAIRWLGKTGARRELTYSELAVATNRFADVLTGLGVLPGERVFVLMGARLNSISRCSGR